MCLLWFSVRCCGTFCCVFHVAFYHHKFSWFSPEVEALSIATLAVRQGVSLVGDRTSVNPIEVSCESLGEVFTSYCLAVRIIL